MKSEDVDKLFNERLGKLSPTPSADLWSRLQTRMEDELPVKEEKKPIFMWARSYAAAAAVTVLLSAGVVFYSVQQDVELPKATVAQTEQPAVTAEVPSIEDADRWVNKGAAVAETVPSEQAVVADEIAKEQIAAIETPAEVVPERAAVKRQVKAKEQVQPKTTGSSNERMFASANTGNDKPIETKEEQQEFASNVSFASARTDMNAAPVEIIIKRSVAVQSSGPVEAEESVSASRDKQQLVKNIFKQVKNLSNGEQVNLSELGLNADRIALETQIGKQKISKVINL